MKRSEWLLWKPALFTRRFRAKESIFFVIFPPKSRTSDQKASGGLVTSFSSKGDTGCMLHDVFSRRKSKVVAIDSWNIVWSEFSWNMPPKKKFRSIPRKKKKFRGNQHQKKEEKIEINRSRQEDSPEVSGDSSSEEEHVETEKAESFKSLPASVRKMKAESSNSSKDSSKDELAPRKGEDS